MVSDEFRDRVEVHEGEGTFTLPPKPEHVAFGPETSDEEARKYAEQLFDALKGGSPDGTVPERVDPER